MRANPWLNRLIRLCLPPFYRCRRFAWHMARLISGRSSRRWSKCGNAENLTEPGNASGPDLSAVVRMTKEEVPRELSPGFQPGFHVLYRSRRSRRSNPRDPHRLHTDIRRIRQNKLLKLNFHSGQRKSGDESVCDLYDQCLNQSSSVFLSRNPNLLRDKAIIHGSIDLVLEIMEWRENLKTNIECNRLRMRPLDFRHPDTGRNPQIGNFEPLCFCHPHPSRNRTSLISRPPNLVFNF